MEETISKAIKSQKRLEIFYRGTKRIIEPHTFGLDKNDGIKLRAYQIGGFSESGNSEGWKLFKGEEITNITELSDYFQVRPGYNYSGDSAIPNIICKIIKN